MSLSDIDSLSASAGASGPASAGSSSDGTNLTGGPPVSAVEAKILADNATFAPQHAAAQQTGENIKTIVVDNFPALGKLCALRFLEWVIANPRGVCALPTGKTPEFFIKCTKRFLEGWTKEGGDVRRELEAGLG